MCARVVREGRWEAKGASGLGLIIRCGQRCRRRAAVVNLGRSGVKRRKGIKLQAPVWIVLLELLNGIIDRAEERVVSILGCQLVFFPSDETLHGFWRIRINGIIRISFINGGDMQSK